jgi:large subunit ribosomal protein L21
MYAVIRAGGKQYRVAPGDVIKLETFAGSGKDNGKVEFAEADILAVSPEAGKITTGGKGATVSAEIVDEGRNKKILVFHYKRKKQYKKLQGHRQGYTAVRITEISLGDKKLAAPDAPARGGKKKKSAGIVSDVAGAAGFAAGLAVGAAEVLTGRAKKKAAPKKKFASNPKKKATSKAKSESKKPGKKN